MKRFLILFLTAALLTSLLSGCGASRNGYAEMESNFKVMETAAETPMAAAVPEYAMTEEMAFDAGAGGYEPMPEVQSPSRKLIKTVYMSIETKTFDDLMNAVYAKVSAAGGYIENSNLYKPSMENNSYARRSANLCIRVPSDRLDTFVNDVEGCGNVTNKSENVQDVTLNYTDVESHKKSLEIERDRLNELIAEATDVDAIIALETRLSEIRYQLDSYESQLRTYDNQVDYSTVSLDVQEVIDYTPQEKVPVWERIKTGFADTIKGLGEFFQNLFVGIIVYSPVLAILAIIVVLIVLLVKKIRNRKQQKLPKKEDDTLQK